MYSVSKQHGNEVSLVKTVTYEGKKYVVKLRDYLNIREIPARKVKIYEVRKGLLGKKLVHVYKSSQGYEIMSSIKLAFADYADTLEVDIKRKEREQRKNEEKEAEIDEFMKWDGHVK